jgi:hypothetical protein
MPVEERKLYIIYRLSILSADKILFAKLIGIFCFNEKLINSNCEDCNGQNYMSEKSYANSSYARTKQKELPKTNSTDVGHATLCKETTKAES